MPSLLDFAPGDIANTVSGINQGTSILQSLQALQNSQGVNPQLLQAQSGVDLQRAQLAQEIANTPAAPLGQNYVQNEDSPYLAQLRQLIGQGPPQFTPMGTRFGFDPSAGVHQALLNEYNNQLGAARIGANFDTRILSPAERQQLENKNAAGQLDTASSILGGAKPQQAFDPAQLGPVLSLFGGAIGGAQKSRDAQITAYGELGKAQAQSQLELQKQALANQGQIDVENIKANGKPPTEAENKAQDALNENIKMLGRVGQLASSFKPEYFSFSAQARGTAEDALGQWGIDITGPDSAPRKEFLDNMQQLADEHVKLLGGYRGLSHEKTREYLLQPILNAKNGPEGAKASIVSMYADIQLAMAFQQAELDRARARGRTVNPNDPDIVSAVRRQVQAASPEAKKLATEAIYQHYPDLKPSSSNVPAYQGGVPTNDPNAIPPAYVGNKDAIQAARQELLQKGWVQDPTTGKLSKPSQTVAPGGSSLPTIG